MEIKCKNCVYFDSALSGKETENVSLCGAPIPAWVIAKYGNAYVKGENDATLCDAFIQRKDKQSPDSGEKTT